MSLSVSLIFLLFLPQILSPYPFLPCCSSVVSLASLAGFPPQPLPPPPLPALATQHSVPTGAATWLGGAAIDAADSYRTSVPLPYRASTAALPSRTVARGPVPAARLGCGMPTGQEHRGKGREWGSSAERRGHLSGMKQTWRAGTVSGRSRHGDRCGGWIFFILLISSTTGCAPMVMRYLIITVDPNPTGA